MARIIPCFIRGVMNDPVLPGQSVAKKCILSVGYGSYPISRVVRLSKKY